MTVFEDWTEVPDMLKAKVSIVILNWNGCAMMERFLPSVVRWSVGAEIVVADNASTDDSMVWLEKHYPEVRRIRLDRNYGFAEGYNRALRQVNNTYYLLLNSDVEVPENWLSPLLSYMETHPELAACQPKLRSYWQKDYFEYAGAAGGYIDMFGYPYCRGRLMASVELDRGQYDEVSRVLWASGAALFIRKADYWEAGGLDARFFAHQEEIDLCWRLCSSGRGVACIPQSVVYHLGGGTLPKDNPRKTFLNFRNNLFLLYKNLPDSQLGYVMRWRIFLDALAAFQFLVTGQFGCARAVWQAWKEYRHVRKDFAADRKENLEKAVLSPVPEQSTFSLLWHYYVRGVRAWSRLPQ